MLLLIIKKLVIANSYMGQRTFTINAHFFDGAKLVSCGFRIANDLTAFDRPEFYRLEVW